ncbi:deoxyribodipyrimidine photo-lyase [Lapillicoccus jejuensis]|uniref:deoxyribodipyrimidine photo-lyase n=1 Tax=Lapillicoccus jejuensis TaxID=402171 RepID=UPI001B85B577|nr:deoxyribodipyrimidine photo-lyase [Lapillicoccus jejuensis]
MLGYTPAMAQKKSSGTTGTATDGEPQKDPYTGIQAERVRTLQDGDPDGGGRYVLYWMQSSVRADLNHALEYAVHRANDLEKPLLVCFGLMDDYPEANARHYLFLLQGLADVAKALEKRKIPFVVQRGAPYDVAIELGRKAALVVLDRGYLRHQKQWYDKVVGALDVPVVQVETDVVVPVETASDKRESAARTLRPKITKHLTRFLVPLPTTTLKDTTAPRVKSEDVSDPEAYLKKLKVDDSAPPVRLWEGGNTAARKQLKAFLSNSFSSYSDHRNQPQTDDVSHMSKYLHYGHISPVAIALEVGDRHGKNADDLLEELIVRRELPMNYVFYEKDYDKYSALPEWARTTLDEHRDDNREHQYTAGQLEKGETHDEYWNAAMKEMVVTGYLHNYMRMYWGKKIIEWSTTPETAYKTAITLNNKYLLDGRDPNSWSNISWLFGNQDRGWTERPVLGKVRWMSAGGLERKADPKAYVEKVDKLAEQVERQRAKGA